MMMLLVLDITTADDAPKAGVVADRDRDYTTSFGTITLKAGKVMAEVEISIDPHNVEDTGHSYPRYILVGGDDIVAVVVEDTDDAAAGNQPGRLTIPLIPVLIEITDEGVSQVATFQALPIGRDAHILLESDPETTIPLEVTLTTAVTAEGGQPVTINLITTGDGTAGTRDDDYQVRLGPSLTIAKGEKTGTVDVIVKPLATDADVKFKVEAKVGKTAGKAVTITIRDENKDSKNIALTGRVLEPAGRENLKLYEEDGAVKIEITATLDGKALGADAVVSLTLSAAGDAKGGSATRDVDYDLEESSGFTIPKGSTTATHEIVITPKPDTKEEKDGETIILGDLNGKAGKAADPTADLDPAVAIGTLTITLMDGKDPDAPADTTAADTTADTTPDPITLVEDDPTIKGTVGTALSEELPAATAADTSATVKYLPITGLPDGLKFDAATRTIAGTPTAAGTDTVTYYATDGSNIKSVDYIITIADAPTPVVEVKAIEAKPDLLRENAGHATTIALTVMLEKAAEADEEVTLTFVDPNAGGTAERDEDFVATWATGPVITIAKGETTGTAEVSVTPIQNSEKGEKAFGIQATTETGLRRS